MCQNCCQQIEKMKEKPERCTPGQILECHGDTGEHPCAEEVCTPESEEDNP